MHPRTSASQSLHAWTLLLLMAALAPTAACSFTQHWDEATLACDGNVVGGRTNFCSSGYTCFNPTVTCIADASRNLGQACTDARQCQLDQLCPADNLAGTGIAQQDDVQTCLRKCAATSPNGGFFQSTGCLTNYYCSPFLNGPAAAATTSIVGACVPTDGCTPGTDCNIDNHAGGICVPISDTANGCIDKCQITWQSTATYTDNCASDQYCQPVGIVGAQQMVCLSNTRNVQANNANCNIITAPCSSGSVCSPLGTCAPYCRVVNNPIASLCGNNEVCCPFAEYGSGQDSGFCAAHCP